MSQDMSAVLLQRLLEIESRKDSIEFGPANARVKVYVNSSDPASAVDNIQTMIDLRAFSEVATPRPITAKPKEAGP